MCTEEFSVNLPQGKQAFFLSDFHLGSPDYSQSRQREDRVVAWIKDRRKQIGALFLLGDIFDYWFEYRFVVPKGHIRLLGALAELCDAGIPVHFFCGNHDLWMRDYFKKEIGIRVHTGNAKVTIGETVFLVGHGDGIGPNEKSYKFMKAVFGSPISKAFYAAIHPYWASLLACRLSRHSRRKGLSTGHREREKSKNTHLIDFIAEYKDSHPDIDIYVFAHRHWPVLLDLKKKKCVGSHKVDIENHTVKAESRTTYYVNTGDWLRYDSFVSFDGHELSLNGKLLQNTL